MTDLESRVTVVERGLDELRKQVDTLTPLVAAVAVLAEQVKTMNKDLATFADQAAEDRKAAANREAERTRQKAANRQWVIGLLVVVVIGLITAAAELHF